MSELNKERLDREELFHDSWADDIDSDEIDIKAVNEACTAPEMRYIRSRMGDLKNKTVLDVGCGLGEASVYFATLGADVIATDISAKMLARTEELASRYNVSVRTHKSTAESLGLSKDEKFDFVYVGNLFHHVNIDETLNGLACHVKQDGLLLSWDPVAYNPLINIYRKKAMSVRTSDEHPLKLADIRKFKRYFKKVECRWFWFTTLSIFLFMYLFQKRDPNKERYWKSILYEADKWRPIYRPLECIDRVILKVFPFFRPLCWNVVVVANGPISSKTGEAD